MTSPADLKMTIGDLLDRQADRFGDRDALVHVDWDLRHTWHQFRAECDRVARGLMALGINKGDHVAIWSTNYPEWVAAQFATAKIGAVLVTVNPAYRTHELEFLLNQSDAVALMLIGNFRTSDYAAMLGEVAPELATSVPGQLHSEKLPRLRNVIFIPPHDGTAGACPPGMFAWAGLAGLGEEISASALAQRQSGCHPDDVICIMYTSGTTGNPKGVMLTHHNLVANATYTMQGLRFTQDDRLCIPVPFYHCFGSVLGTLACATTAAAMVIPSEYFDPGKALIAVEKERCTAIHGVPTMFIAELEHPDFDRFDLGSLRTGIMAGSPCPIEVMRQVIDRMGCREMTVGYGLTEAAPIITLTRSDDTIERRVSTVGTVIPTSRPGSSTRIQGKRFPPESRASCAPQLHEHEGLLQATRGQRGRHRRGWLAPHRRPGHRGRRGLLQDHRPLQGHDHPRRGERLPPRDRGVPLHQPQGGRRPGRRRPRPAVRRGDNGLGAAAGRRAGHRGGDPGLLPRPHRPLQGPRYVKFVSEFPMTVTGKIQKFVMREISIRELELEGAANIETD